MTFRVAVVIGTRPEAIKMAPVVAALREHPDLQTILISTAQHRQMLDQVLPIFGLKPDVDLGLMEPAQDLGELTSRVLVHMRRTLQDVAPHLVFVQGDTTTVMATALAAFYSRIPIGHVEAGLRTYDLDNPFPEEANRRVAGIFAALHFAPTSRAADALLAEGVPPERVMVTGNTCIDALQWTAAVPFTSSDPGLSAAIQSGRMVLVTSHRRESFGPELESICLALRDLVTTLPDVHVVYPVHLNPHVRQTVTRCLHGVDRVHLLDPLDYQSFVYAMRHATLVLTDSGGVQEEAPSLGKPVLVLRHVTERPEAAEAGLAKVIGTDREAIVGAARTLLTQPLAYAAMVGTVSPYGDGEAARRIALASARWLRGERPLLDPGEQFCAAAVRESMERVA